MKKILYLGVLFSFLAMAPYMVLATYRGSTASADQVYDFSSEFDPQFRNTRLFKYAGKLYAIHSTGDTLVTEDPEDISVPIQVSVATNEDLSSWEDASDVAPFSSLTDHAFEIEKFFIFKKFIYAMILSTEGSPELWRLKKGSDTAVWQQVGQDTFAPDLVELSSTVVRLKTTNLGAALFVVGQTPDGNVLYRTTNGVDWQLMDPNATFTSNSSHSFVRMIKRRDGDTRYVYAFEKNGQVLRAPLEDMNLWEEVFAVDAVSTDADTPDPDFTLTSAAQLNGKLYIIGEANNDEPGGQLFLSTDWTSASLTDQFDSVGTHWVFRKLEGTLYVLADLGQGLAWLLQITDSDTAELLLDADNDFGHDEKSQFTSLVIFNALTYFSYRDSDGSRIFTLAD